MMASRNSAALSAIFRVPGVTDQKIGGDAWRRARVEILQLEREQVRAINRDKTGGMGREERFLSAQADAFAGAKAEEKIGLLRSE